ncbi:glycoside hydrolase family 6 protein [Streptomyces sp. DSM 41982]|uniref:Glucanase n=1 Tax=Streptomyces evansiae TaxID=3075535 RepID=A0ABD5E4K0_9ACTN|nr:glycoside hydrolase family 6 protein [Streptomyces sp. DSM 41982]MDT0415732.1 glycoside hydrolase family 6 protein [Streptomyces sp. DSM 41982]
MVAAASCVVLAGGLTGLLTAGGGEHGGERVATAPAPSLAVAPEPSSPAATLPSRAPSPRTTAPAPSRAAPASRTPAAGPSALPGAPTSPAGPDGDGKSAASGTGAGAGAGRLFRFPDSQVADWVDDHPADPRADAIEDGIARRPAAVWFADHSPGTITARVTAVTRAAARADAVPVLVAYDVPGRDCGGASQGGAPDLAAYDDWITRFARGLGDGENIVILEPDAIAQSDCLPAADRAARFASLERAARVLKAAGPRTRVYFDAGHSGWLEPDRAAALLRQAGAARAGDGIFTNVSHFHRTADETAYARAVLDALGGPPGLGAVVDTSRNGNGAPPGGAWCDPAGRALGTPPTLRTGQARIDAYLWVKLPGESDGCTAAPGTFSPEAAYALVRG